MYFFTKCITKSGPPKEFFDRIDFNANRFLRSLKDNKVRNVLLSFNALLMKFLMALILVLFIAAYFFSPLSLAFQLNWFSLFGLSALFSMSIPWNLDHKNYVKKYFFGSFIMLIPLAPLIALMVGKYARIDLFESFRTLPLPRLHEYTNGDDLTLAFILAGIFFVIYVIIPYVLFWILFLPVFYSMMFFVKTFQKFLDYVHRYIDENILLVLMGLTTIVIAPL